MVHCVCAHNNKYTFNSLLVLQLSPLWIGLLVGSGQVWSGNLDPRATLRQTHTYTQTEGE